MQDCKPISTLFPTDVKLSSKMSPSSEKERMEMSQVPYASAVGSLMFTMIYTRPDIAHAVGVVSQYMAEPSRGHWEDVKRILRYVKGTSDVALCFGDSDLIVTGYVDSDYAGDLDGSKSTTGYVFTLSGRIVSWVSKLQSVVAMSTTEAEYVASAQASKEAVWLKMLLEELGHKQEKITLFCDNQSALYLARNPAFHSKTKHIRVQYHFVREKVEEGTVDMQKIHTDDNRKRKQHESARKDNGVKMDLASIESSSGRFLSHNEWELHQKQDRVSPYFEDDVLASPEGRCPYGEQLRGHQGCDTQPDDPTLQVPAWSHVIKPYEIKCRQPVPLLKVESAALDSLAKGSKGPPAFFLSKQMVAEKTSELERCLSELQDILIALEAAESRNAELTHAEIFSNSLQEALSQRDMILKKCAQIMAILINTPGGGSLAGKSIAVVPAHMVSE
ncbi:hypothetical protein Tco_0802052, partial [Tanacetum coccineum]